MTVAPISSSVTMFAPAARAPTLSESGANDFSTMISSMTASAINSVRDAEAVGKAGLSGDASPKAVVEAVMEAERSMQTALAVRDKAVSAYLELTRMTI